MQHLLQPSLALPEEVGAAVGGTAGALIGNYMDKQEAKLRQQMAGTGVDVVRKGDNITLDMPGGVTFAVGSAPERIQWALGVLTERLRETGLVYPCACSRKEIAAAGTPVAVRPLQNIPSFDALRARLDIATLMGSG